MERWMGFVLGILCTAILTTVPWAEEPSQKAWEAWEIRKRHTQDRICGVPEKVLQKQSVGRVAVPSLDAAVSQALQAAEKAAAPLINPGDPVYHTGKKWVVPDDYPSIQSAIDAAKPRDIIVVKPGTYFELIVMKDGIKLVSDKTDGGDQPVKIKGARLSLPKRTLRTIIDGSREKASNRGMIDFNEDVGRQTIVDGFTLQNLPLQDHHIPGHAHAINARGASPIIMRCYVRNNGSTGIGNHVVFHDQGKRAPERDFRWENVKKQSSGVIYKNIFEGNVGLGIGCNHFSSPIVLGNEVLANNDSQLGHDPSPGIGAKHGSFPTLIGNLVHDNPGGGILCKTGEPQGVYPIDRPAYPTIMNNVVFQNGTTKPGISANGIGSKKTPVRIGGNMIFDAGTVGIGFSNGSVGFIEDNMISGSRSPGIEIRRSVVLKLNGNQVAGARGPGILMGKGARIKEMSGNVSDGNRGPRFMLRGGTIDDG